MENKIDKRKFNKGTKGNAGGRPRGSNVTKIFDKHFEKMITDLKNDELVKKEIAKILSKRPTKERKFIYMIQSSDRVTKIGITSDFKNRFKSYNSHTGYSLEILFFTEVEKANELEKKLCDLFKNKQHKGDWFNLDNEDIIESIKLISKHKNT